MLSGVLKEIIDVYRKTVVRNDFGEEVESYTKVHSYRAGVSHQSTRRAVINYEIQYPYTKFLIVRIFADIDENDIILYDNKYYRITSIEINKDLQNKRIDIERSLDEYTIYTPTSYTSSYTTTSEPEDDGETEH